MAGHSKWANIKHRKSAQDAKKGKIFTKLIREITSLTRQNPNIDGNSALRLAIDKALEANMSRDTIDRAISRGLGHNDEAEMVRIIYEGYGLEGIAYIIVTLTDNRNRTVAEVRHALDKFGGNLSVEGSVAYMFDFCSWVTVDGSLDNQVLEQLLSLVDDVVDDHGAETLLCKAETLSSIKKICQDNNYTVLEAQTGYKANIKVTNISDEAREAHEKILDMLLDLDDVQEVYHNLDE